MGWDGGVKSDLQEAKEGISKYPINSLGWYLAVIKYNDIVIGVDEEDFEYFEVEENPNDPGWAKLLEYPRFNMNQILEI